MPLFHSYTLADELTYSSGALTNVDLPKNGYITRLDCMLEASVTPGATVEAHEDALARLIASARVHAAGETYFDIGDGRDWWYWTYFRHRGAITSDSLPAAGGAATTVRTMFEIHLGFEPQRTPNAYLTPDGRLMRTFLGGPFDTTVVIPTIRLSNPKLEVRWGTNASLGTGFTLGTTTMSITVHEIVLEGDETEARIWPGGLLVPRVESTSEPLSTGHTNKSLRHDVPTQLVLYQTLGMILNGSDVRSDSIVSEFSVEFPPQRQTPVDYDWYEARIENRKRTETPANKAGLFFLEWPLVSGNELGIDLMRKRPSDVQLGLSNTATTDGVARFMHVGYLPERG